MGTMKGAGNAAGNVAGNAAAGSRAVDAAAGDWGAAPVLIAVPPRRFTAEDMEAYAALTGDYNPIHRDRDFAAGTRFGHPIAFGTLVVATIWTRLEELFGPDALRDGEASIQFLKPVAVGTGATVEGRLEEGGGRDGIRRYRFTVTTEAGETAAEVAVALNPAGAAPEGRAR